MTAVAKSVFNAYVLLENIGITILGGRTEFQLNLKGREGTTFVPLFSFQG